MHYYLFRRKKWQKDKKIQKIIRTLSELFKNTYKFFFQKSMTQE